MPVADGNYLRDVVFHTVDDAVVAEKRNEMTYQMVVPPIC